MKNKLKTCFVILSLLLLVTLSIAQTVDSARITTSPTVGAGTKPTFEIIGDENESKTDDDRGGGSSSGGGSSGGGSDTNEVDVIKNRETLRKEFVLSKETTISDENVRKITTEKQRDATTVKKITVISNRINEKRRVGLAVSLLSIDRGFIDRFEETIQKNTSESKKLEEQLEEYSTQAKEPSKIRDSLTKDKIKEFFNNKNQDELINYLLHN